MPVLPYHLDCDPSGELSTQKPAYLTSMTLKTKANLNFPTCYTLKMSL